MRAAWLAAGLALGGAACEVPAPRPGRVEAAADTAFTVALGGRALVLDGFAGSISVATGAATDSATVRVRRAASGATPASARRRLARVGVHTAADAELVQVVWRTPLAAGARAAVQATVPPRTVVVARLDAGRIAVRCTDCGADAEVDSGEVVVSGRPLGLRLRARTGTLRFLGPDTAPQARWRASVGTGSVLLAFAPDAAATLTATARDGQVRLLDSVLTGVQRDGRPPAERVRGQIGPGGTSIWVESRRGNVDVARSGVRP